MQMKLGPIVLVGTEGYLQILFIEDAGLKGEETKVTFMFQFVPDWECHVLKHLVKGANTLFPDAKITRPPKVDTRAYGKMSNLVFTRTVATPIRNPEGLLQAVKNQLQKVLEVAWTEADKEIAQDKREHLVKRFPELA